jgi:hypothetical protein
MRAKGKQKMSASKFLLLIKDVFVKKNRPKCCPTNFFVGMDFQRIKSSPSFWATFEFKKYPN